MGGGYSRMFDHWVFLDESGAPKIDPFFLVGALVISNADRNNLLQRVTRLRAENRFHDELHFQSMSKAKHRMYKAVMDDVLRNINFTANIIVVRRERLDLSTFFSGQSHLAYNKFSQMLIYHRIKSQKGKIGIYVDDKTRVKRDNFLDYLRSELNVQGLVYGHKYDIRTVEPLDSKTDDLAQVNDLFLGAVKQQFDPAPGDRKRDLAAFVKNHPFGWKVDVWNWKPRYK